MSAKPPEPKEEPEEIDDPAPATPAPKGEESLEQWLEHDNW